MTNNYDPSAEINRLLQVEADLQMRANAAETQRDAYSDELADAQELITEMLAAFVRENELSRMGGPKGSGYFRCVICDRVIRPQSGEPLKPENAHHPRCPVVEFLRRAHRND